MRLLLVFFGDDYHGGTTFSTFAIAKELVARGHEVHAYVRPTRSGVLKHDLEAVGVIVHDGRAPIMVYPLKESRPLLRVVRAGLELGRRFWLQSKAEREVARIIADCSIDLVAISSGAITTGARAAQKAGIPYVWHIREFMQEDHGLDFYPWAHAYELMGQASCLICVSEAVRRKMERLCPKVRAEVVYNGLDLEVFTSEGRQERAEGEPLRIMFSGGIKASKGSFLLLDALAQLDPALPVTLDVYGTEGTSPGQTAKDYRARCEELGLADKVCYYGMVSGIAEQYRCHDLLVVASRAEAFGRVTAEGMLCGCAVVGSDSGGTPELIADDRGYLFEPNDAASLAAAITEAVEDPAERARRVERARSYARDNFTVNTYVDKVEALYRAVLA